MKEFKGTKGEWKYQNQFDHPLHIVDYEDDREWYSLSANIFGGKKLIGEVRYSTSLCGFPSVSKVSEMEANAQLIADAGTTINKCGLLPSELLKQKNDLLEALQGFLEVTTLLRFPTEQELNECNKKAKKAINKALGK